ncbi:hypothetical protein [Nocardia sp. NPDC051463]|uniref:hypothetical protein n=1 Tax=Nocardia sp. NPDC051463 TaxID=3154845 RepID=UPI00342E0A0C
MTDNIFLSTAAGFVLPALGGCFKSPLIGAAGGLVGGAVYGLMNKHTGWNLFSDIAIGAVGGGLGASFGRKATEAWLLEGKSGRTIGEALNQFTRGERAIRTANSMSSAGGFATLPLLGKEIVGVFSAGTLPTVNIGRGDR